MRTRDEVIRCAATRYRIMGKLGEKFNLRMASWYYWQARRVFKASVAFRLILNGDKLKNPVSATIYNPPSVDGTRWVSGEPLRSSYADEIDKSLPKGWFTSSYASDTLRGCVYQLPGRKGCARYVAGYEESETKEHRIDFSTVYVADRRTHPDDDDNAKNEAARAANRMAQDDAEDQWEHNEKWQLAREWAEDADEERKAEIEREFEDVAEFAKENL